MADFSGVLNPKRVIDKREQAAQASVARVLSPSQSSTSQSQFAKPFSDAEKAEQARKLAKILADRDGLR